MRTHKKLALLTVLILALVSVAPVAADSGETDEVSPCAGEGVSGTVVAVDEETGVVTVYTSAGLCTVTLDGEYDHPIVALLGSYFGDVSAESLAEELETTGGCAVLDSGSGTWAWADCDTEDAVWVTVIGENDDGTFQALVDSVEVTVTVDDSTIAEQLSEALETLIVGWKLDEEGAVVQPGDEIAAYHADGMGFGALVKLYALAEASQEACADADEPCGVPVEKLVLAFRSGTGFGELFKEYGKPSMLGVGHVRKIVRSQTDDGSTSGVARPSQRARFSYSAGASDHSGPKPKAPKQTGKPDHAGPKQKDSGITGKPDHAGPKPKAPKHTGKPDHAGPKPKSKDK